MSGDQNIVKRQLGHTGIEITPIGLGTWQFSEGQGMHRFSYSVLVTHDTNDIVKAALDGGINWFDTAEYYGNGRSETGLSKALQTAGKANGDVVIATKWWPFLKTARSIKSSIGQRLSCLDPFGIDLHQIHWPFSFSSVEAEMNAMADLVEAGKIRAVGVSNFSAKQMRRAHQALARRSIPLASNQVRYNLLGRNIETSGVLETAKELGVTIIAYTPLDMGLLTGKFHRDSGLLRSRPFFRKNVLRRRLKLSRPVLDVIEEIAGARSVTAAQVALNWTVNYHGDTVVAIPGASRAHHAVESAGAMKFTLTDEEMARLDEVSRQFR